MRINDLPEELLVHILQAITGMSRLVCLRVCRKWYRLLLPVVYHTVRIADNDSFSKLIRSIGRSGPIKSSIRHVYFGHGTHTPYRINELPFGQLAISNQDNGRENGAFCPSRFCIRALQRNCRNIESVDCDYYIKTVIWPYLIKWKLLRQVPAFDSLATPLLETLAPRLTSLALTRKAILELNARSGADHCFLPLASLPQLRDLTLSCLVGFGVSEIGPLPLDLRQLLEYCRRLQSLCLCMFKIDPAAQKEMCASTPQPRYPLKALTLEMVEFESFHTVAWLSQVTPNLSSLMLCRVNVALSSVIKTDLHMLSLVWAAFVEQHSNTLRHLAVERIWESDDWKRAMLAAVRPQSLTVLRTGTLDMTIHPTVQSGKTSENFVDIILKALSPRAAALEMSLWPALRSFEDEVAKPLAHACRFLTDLELTGCTKPVYKDFNKQNIALDTLLNHLRYLRRLRLCCVNVVSHQSPQTNPLEELWIVDSTLRSRVFENLSRSCPALGSIALLRCHMFVDEAPFTTFTIHMRYTELQSLSIRNLSLLYMGHDKTRHKNRLRVMGGCSSIIAMKHRFGAYYHFIDSRGGLHIKEKQFQRAVKVAEDEAMAGTSIDSWCCSGSSGGEGGDDKLLVADEAFLRKLEREWLDLEQIHLENNWRKGFGIIMVDVKKIHRCVFEDLVIRAGTT